MNEILSNVGVLVREGDPWFRLLVTEYSEGGLPLLTERQCYYHRKSTGHSGIYRIFSYTPSH